MHSSAAAAISPVVPINRLQLLNAFAQKHFCSPDLQALEIILSVIVSHYYEQSDPIWIMVNGRSRGGKTSLGINPLKGLPLTYMMGAITPKTFLSGYTRPGKNGAAGKADSSFLTKIGKSGILLFKDLTTLMSQRQEQRAEILADLREIHDGAITKRTGMSGATEQTWEGKITCIAAVTPAIEREMMILRDLGERFIQVRWRSDNDQGIARAAMNQRGQETDIKRGLQALVKQAIDYDNLMFQVPSLPRPDERFLDRLACLARVASWGRAGVKRDRNGKVIMVYETESPASIAKSFYSLVSARAALHRREVIEEDLGWVSRMALDCMPAIRAKILEWTPATGTTNNSDLTRHCDVPYVTLRHYQDELFALGMLDRMGGEEDVEIKWSMAESFKEIWTRSFPHAL